MQSSVCKLLIAVWLFSELLNCYIVKLLHCFIVSLFLGVGSPKTAVRSMVGFSLV